jgi:tetratricopeptide (TPR) repeat protein
MIQPAPRKKKDSLKIACVIGLIFGLILCGSLAFVHFFAKNPAQLAGNETGFSQALRDFDTFLVVSEETANLGQINRSLDKLEKKAISVESHLSVLKRRRLLAQRDERFLPAYQKAAQKVAAYFPASEQLAVVASESLLWTDTAIEDEAANQLRSYAIRLISPDFRSSALSIYVLLDDLDDPMKAAAIPGREALFNRNLEQEHFLINDAILHILSGDNAAAAVQVNDMLTRPDVSVAARQFAAEFFYDYDKLIQSAEIFAQFSDETSLLRQADALWLSGNTQNARALWTALCSSMQPEIQARSLYNLASSESDSSKAAAYLERLSATLQTADIDKISAPYMVYGIIQYTRLLPVPAAIANLEGQQVQDPLFALEMIRREREVWTQEKAVAQTWLLVNKYPKDERLYQWAGWLFDFQRRYDEAAVLLKNALYNQVHGDWTILYESIALIQKNELGTALERLGTVTGEPALWSVNANIARILEVRHATEEALGHYEQAAALEKSSENAARIQFRMSRCLRTLGRDKESRAALETALRLNPDYLAALAELRRLEASDT